MIAIILVSLIVIVLIFAKAKHISPLSWGMHPKINQAVFSDEAINGYDPVAYFANKNAVKGDQSNVYRWNGASWYFSSGETMSAFKENPEKYAPQFGGYCAYAVSKGFTANSDPKAWTIIEGHLYLFAELKFLDEWLKDKDENLKKSATNWNK